MILTGNDYDHYDRSTIRVKDIHDIFDFYHKILLV